MKKKIYLLFISIILIAAGCKAQATATPLSAALKEVSGKVDAKQAGQDGFNPVSNGSVLEVNGQIQTGADGRVRLDLTSGTIIRVAPSSLFTLTANDEVTGGLATQIKLEIGKVFIILNGGSASVDTPNGVATVRGSYLKTEVDPVTFDVYVTCLEGDCSASNPAGTVNFKGGEKTVLFHKDPATGNWTVPNVEPMTPDEFQEWLDENPEAKDIFDQAMISLTAIAEPTAPPVVESVIPAAGASGGCLNIIEPTEGSSIPFRGKVKFEWDSKPGAKKYIVSFKTKNGTVVSFDSTETNVEKYIEGILPDEGDISWGVTAVGEDGKAICTTELSTFSKPDSNPEPEPPIQDKEEYKEEATPPPCQSC